MTSVCCCVKIRKVIRIINSSKHSGLPLVILLTCDSPFCAHKNMTYFIFLEKER